MVETNVDPALLKLLATNFPMQKLVRLMEPYFVAVNGTALLMILLLMVVFLRNVERKEFHSVFSFLWLGICLTSSTISACDLALALGNFETRIKDAIQGAQFLGINIGAVTYAVTIYLRARADITMSTQIPRILFGLVCLSGFVSGVASTLSGQALVPRYLVFGTEVVFGLCLIAFDVFFCWH